MGMIAELYSTDSGCFNEVDERPPDIVDHSHLFESKQNVTRVAKSNHPSPEVIQKAREKYASQIRRAIQELEALKRPSKINLGVINAATKCTVSTQNQGSRPFSPSQQSSGKQNVRTIRERGDQPRKEAQDQHICSDLAKVSEVKLPEQTIPLEVHQKGEPSTPKPDDLWILSRRKSNGSDDSGIASSPVLRKGFASAIDDELRERIAHPKQRVFIYNDPPQDNVLFINQAKRAPGTKSTSISLVHAEPSLGSDLKMEEFEKELELCSQHVSDQLCTMYMRWGFCYSGDSCNKRHPTCRYPCTPTEDSDAAHVREDEGARGSQSKTQSSIGDVQRDRCRERRSYASLLKPKVKTETRQENLSYEDMFPALGSGGRVNWTLTTDSSTPNQENTGLCVEGRSFSSEHALNKLHPQTESDSAIAEAAQAEEFAPEVDETHAFNFEPHEAEEYELEYEPEEDSLFDAAVSESLSMPQPPSETSNPAPIPVWAGSDIDIVDEQTGICEVCNDRPKNATLLCGHRFCYRCACQMRIDGHQCAICRRPIITVIKTFN